MPDQHNNLVTPSFSVAAENAEFERDFRSAYTDSENKAAVDFALGLSEEKDQGGAVDSLNQNFDEQMQKHGDTAVARGGIGMARDVSLGLLQSPRSAARGVISGVNGVLDFVQAVNDLVPTLSFLDSQGKDQIVPDVVLTGTWRDRKNKQLQSKYAGQADIPDANGFRLPLPDKPAIETNTGDLIEAISQFATGFGVIGKAGKLLGLAAPSSAAGSVAASTGKGALAEMLVFDGHQERLSNVIQKIPALQNPVTEALAADPSDGEWEAKLKQGIEGVVTGAAGEVLFRGVSALKKLYTARAALKAEGKTMADALGDLPLEEKAGIGLQPRHFDFLGDAGSDAYLIQKGKLDVAADEVAAAAGKTKPLAKGADAAIPDYEINFARINAPDDIKGLMDEMVNRPELKPSIAAARRGGQSHADTILMADDLDGFNLLMTRRQGQAFNAEEVTAARRVYTDTARKLYEAAHKAAAADSSDVDVFNFRKMVAIHHAVQKEFMGMRAEAGRALSAWSIPLGGSPARNLREMERVLDEFGGADIGKDLARRVSSASDLTATQLNTITREGVFTRSRKALEEVWTLGLLTNPVTHVVNGASNAMTTLVLGAERFGMAAVPGSPVTVREGLSFWAGLLDSQKMAIKNAAQALRTGQSSFGGGLKTDGPLVRNTSREILDPDGKAGVLSKAIDWYGAFLNKNVGGALLSVDEYFKTVLSQAQLRALATRQGIAQGLEGAALKKHIAETVAFPSQALWEEAEDFAKYGTHTRELGQQGKAFQRLVSRVPLARFVVPFIRTPANIFKFTFERTPLAYLSGQIRADMAAGGATRAAAMTRLSMGTSIMAIGADMALNGQITGSGPSDPKKRAALQRTGWQPYSIKIGEDWYSYQRFEPVATLLGMAADISEILSNYEAYDIRAQEDTENLVTASIIAAGNQAIGKTFMTGFADLTEALSDPKRYGAAFLNKFAGSFVPAGVAAVERAISPEIAYVTDLKSAMAARIPGLSEFVPPRRNIWGEEIKAFYPSEDIFEGTADRVLSLFNPVYHSADTHSAVDKWLVHSGFSIDMPDKDQDFDGVRIDLRDHPSVYDDLVKNRAAIKLLKYGDVTMKEFFENLATASDPYARHIGFYTSLGRDFSDQQNFISAVVRDYTKAAKSKAYEDHIETLGPLVERGKKAAFALSAVRGPVQKERVTP